MEPNQRSTRARKSPYAKRKVRRELTVEGLRALDAIREIGEPVASQLIQFKRPNSTAEFQRNLSAKFQLATEFDVAGSKSLAGQIEGLLHAAARLRKIAGRSVTSAEERILEAARAIDAVQKRDRGTPAPRVGIDSVLALIPIVEEIGRAKLRGWIDELLPPTGSLATDRRLDAATATPTLRKPRSSRQLTPAELEVLQAMHSLRAFNEGNRKSAGKIAAEAMRASVVSSAFKRRLRFLRERKLIDVLQAGRDGGYWLSKKGKLAAEKQFRK